MDRIRDEYIRRTEHVRCFRNHVREASLRLFGRDVRSRVEGL